MKTEFEYKTSFHGDEGKRTGYVNLSYVTHFAEETGQIGFVGGPVAVIAKGSREEMAKALENYEKSKIG